MTETENREFAALEAWIGSSDCEWLEATFRAEGVVLDRRAIAALRWTLSMAGQRWRTSKKLRRVLFYGGDADGVAPSPHIQGLIELPKGASFEEFEAFLKQWWKHHLKERFKREIDCDVWLKPRENDGRRDLRYYARYEGPTFSRGLEKVVVELLEL